MAMDEPAQTQVTTCCTCARLFDTWDRTSEKPIVPRVLDCCGRVICGHCQKTNPRFEQYCPYCQISTGTSCLPPGLRDPPQYSPPVRTVAEQVEDGAPRDQEWLDDEELPSYESLSSRRTMPAEKESSSSSEEPAEDVLHFLHHPHDTLSSLALRYGVPIAELKRSNGLWSDHLLAARRTIIIPGAFYRGGVSLSPRPVEGEEEESRKAKVRRFMVACKVADYDVALVYLRQADYDLEKAVGVFKDEERWEQTNPLNKGKDVPTGRKRFFGRF